MINQLRYALIWLVMVALPVSAGKTSAEPQAETKSTNEVVKEVALKEAAPKKTSPASSTCLVSEELIQDMELREQKISEKEQALLEKEKELEAQKLAISDEMKKLEEQRAELQGVRGKEMAAREEQLGKLIDAFETMSPKAAAQVISKVDEELATIALSRVTTQKAAKILAAMDVSKSSRLSEMIAFGASGKPKGKEKNSASADADRTPASSSR